MIWIRVLYCLSSANSHERNSMIALRGTQTDSNPWSEHHCCHFLQLQVHAASLFLLHEARMRADACSEIPLFLKLALTQGMWLGLESPVPIADGVLPTHSAVGLGGGQVSWKPDPGAIATDALSQPWTDLKGYEFPPFSLIGRCLSKIQHKKVPELILIAPVWPESNSM